MTVRVHQSASADVMLGALVSIARALATKRTSLVWRACIALGLAVLSIPAFSQSAVAQQTLDRSRQPPSTSSWFYGWRDACPRGQRIAAMLGSTILYVDLRWLQYIEIEPVSEGTTTTCPTQPARARDMLFNYPSGQDDIHRIWLDRALPHRLMISEYRPSRLPTQDSAALPSDPSMRRELPGGGSVEDFTRSDWFWITQRRPDARAYRLLHPAGSDGVVPAPIVVRCVGLRTSSDGRACNTIYQYGPDLIVEYVFKQDRAPGHLFFWPTPDGAIPEPDGFLALDARVRAFIDDLRRQP